MTWLEDLKKNRPQSNALSYGIYLTLASGLHIVFGLMNFAIIIQAWTRGLNSTTVLFVISSWYFAVPVGLLIGRFMLIYYGKKLIGFVSSGFFAISGILFIAAPHLMATILVGRCLAGIGHGIMYLTTIVHGSEILAKNNRGIVLADISLNITLTGTVMVVFNRTLGDPSTIDPNRVLGIIQLSLAAIACLFGAFFCDESPIFLLQRNREPEAKAVMKKLQSEPNDTHEILAELDDLKTLVAEEKGTVTSLFGHGNWRPLLTIAVLRILSVLTFNYPLNFVRVVLATPTFTVSTQIFIMCVRLLVASLTKLAFDSVPRRVFFIVSGIGSFGALALLTIFVQVDSGINFGAFAGVVLVYDAMSALAIPQLTDIYSAEAFPLSKKFDSLCAVKLVENLLQAGLVMSMADVNFGRGTILAILYTFTILMGAAVIFLCFRLPETLNKSIREARDLFRGDNRNPTM